MERIGRDMKRVFEHAKHYSGIEKKDAVIIENEALDIAAWATKMATMAQAAKRGSRGDKRRSRR